jgi:hypothetical protein
METERPETGGATPAKSQIQPKVVGCNWPNFEQSPSIVTPFVSLFLNGPEPHIFKAASILRKSS